jgi:hypothetical protein
MSSRPKGAATPDAVVVATSPDRATARERREREGATVSRQLARTLVDHDVSHGDLATLIGRCRSKVQQLTDPEQPDAYSVADMRLSPPEVAADMARSGLEPHGYEVRKVHAHDTIGDDLAHLGEVIAAGAEIAAHELRACSDGTITAAEADVLIKMHREAIELHEASVHRLTEALRERVSLVRRSKGSSPS